LIDRKYVDFDVISDRLGSYIVSNWKKREPWIIASRKEKSDRFFGELFERLYEKPIANVRETEAQTLVLWDQHDLMDINPDES
jgi:hypothetical protein